MGAESRDAVRVAASGTSKVGKMMYRRLIPTLAATLWSVAALAQSTPGVIDRTVLPIPEPPRPTFTELDARNVKPPPRFDVKAPQGAPNVVVILIDDLGFGAPSTFGGPISMPTLDQLAKGGLSYNNFHTAALCSPTRMALKTGRNHHQGEAGSIMETSTGFPGNTGQVPNSVAPRGRDAAPQRLQHERLRQVA